MRLRRNELLKIELLRLEIAQQPVACECRCLCASLWVLAKVFCTCSGALCTKSRD